ncbi:MAG: nitroreductase/quinone reductase family protein [Natrialbaceae archaeon]|nr:nitroreductase/quinone reductase family protein [Natrialbaceae archaeon]
MPTGAIDGTYRARDATTVERETYWPRAKQLYIGFSAYEQWADREIPIVVLEASGQE